MKSDPLPRKRIVLYALLQASSLAVCWIWFAALWSFAFFVYSWEQFEWWLLVAAACAGLYGLRPNLERAIDTAWLQGLKSAPAVAERVAQLRPIKRRIDLIFTVSVVGLLLAGLVLYGALLFLTGGRGAS